MNTEVEGGDVRLIVTMTRQEALAVKAWLSCVDVEDIKHAAFVNGADERIGLAHKFAAAVYQALEGKL